MGLWRRLMALIFRRTYATGIIPFAPGRIYQCTYRSGRPGYIIHDPRPSIFVLSSDNMYTTGLNAHYLGPLAYTLANWIIAARKGNTPLNGLVIYHALKTMYPAIPKLSFRKYFTKNLKGVLVSAGLSNMPEPNAVETMAEAWIRKINQTFKATVAPKEKIKTEEQAKQISQYTRMTQYDKVHPASPLNKEYLITHRRKANDKNA